MNYPMKSTHVVFVVLICSLVVLGCGRTNQSTPRATMDTLKSAIEDEDWDQLYAICHPALRGTYVHRWRSDLRTLLKNRDTGVDVGAGDIDQLTNKQIFRTYLEILSRDPKTRAMLSSYQTARYELNKSNKDTPTININSSRPLPITTVLLSKEDNHWLLRQVN